MNHDISPALVEEIQQQDDSPLNVSMFDEFGDLHQREVQHLDVFWELNAIVTGDICCMLIHMRAILLRKIGSHSGLILDGNLNRLSKKPTKLVPGLEVVSLTMIT